MTGVPGIELRAPSEADIDHVCRRLRALDRAEIFALRHGDGVDALIEDLVLHAPGFLELRAVAPAHAVHRACGLVGLFPIRPHVAGALFFGTDELGALLRPLTRWIRRALIPRAQSRGLHRVEVQALESWRSSCRWIESLGAVREATLPLYGKAGETFVQFAWYGPRVDPRVTPEDDNDPAAEGDNDRKEDTDVHLGTVRPQEVEAA